MSRPLLIIIGIVVLVVGAAAVILIGGGGAQAPVADSRAEAAGAAAGPDIRTEIDGAAVARFEAWAEPLRAAGFTIASDRVANEGGALVISGLDVTGPPDSLAWRWSAPSVGVENIDGASIVFRPMGTQTLTFTMAGVAHAFSFTADTMRIELQKDAGGRASALTVRLGDLTLQGEDGGAPLTLADGEWRFALAAGEGLVPARSTATLRLSDLVLPGQAGGPLGTTIVSLVADIVIDRSFSSFALGAALTPWLASEAGLTVTNLELEWGALQLAGNGALTLDELGRPAGRFEVEIVEILTVLDAFHVVLRFDRALLANTYAALLEEMGRNPGARSLPFTIVVANGDILLLSEARGIADIVIGKIAPLFTPVPP